MERSGGDGFWMVVELEVCTVDREDGVDLREMKMIMVMMMNMKTTIGLQVIRFYFVVESFNFFLSFLVLLC